MRIVAGQRDVVIDKIEQRIDLRIERQPWQRPWLALKLEARLLDVIEIEVCIAEGVDQLPRLQPGHLRHHHRQQGVGGDVERYAEENIARALIELARQLSVRNVELEQAMAGRQRHGIDVRRVPRRHDQPA